MITLPEPMKAMTLEERKAYVATKQAERAEIQKQIQELSRQRDAFVASKLAEQGQDGDTLDKVVVETVREQAKAKGYQFEKK